MSIIEYIVYYKQADKNFRAYNNISNKCYELNKLPNDISNFYLPDTYIASDENLIKYSCNLYEANEQLKKTKILTFDYIKPYITPDGKVIPRTHFKNIESVFKMLCKGKYEHHEQISDIEFKWFEKCYNAGLQYTEIGIFDSFGYDFKNYYGSILASKDFKIPNKQGKERKFNKLPPKIYTGFYNVKITSDDPSIKKIFAFSKENVYTSLDLKFALELQKQFNINIELITDVEFNAYIYNLDTLEEGHKIFNYWFLKLTKLKAEMPKNILLKMISSSLWGHLSKNNTLTVTEEEAFNLSEKDEEAYSIHDIITTKSGQSFYKLLNVKKPYFYNIRLKPFITSFGRVKTAKIALLNLDKVIRVHTDGIVFSEQQKFNIENFISEDKTTNKIRFANINTYFHICSQCNNEFKWKDYQNHKH
jgi:hypothetical protein